MHLRGVDILRGIGIFFVVWLHSAFYYFGGIFDLDLENPPAIVTVIGLLLMFAGMFAMISGLVHHLQFENRLLKGVNPKAALKHQLAAGVFILIIAYVYFMFTGPGIIHFDTRTFDNSFLVELIRNGAIKGISQERILYIDSLVMLGFNAILGGFVIYTLQKMKKRKKEMSSLYLALAGGFLMISLVRIPLYELYLKAVSDNNMGIILLLNWFVNKNNPIFPFFAFCLLGMWISSLIVSGHQKRILSKVLKPAIPLFIMGVLLYIFLPDTMLQRSIDLKYFSIILAQAGLFSIMIAGTIQYFDNRKQGRKRRLVSRFFYRYGVAGFSVFFLESIVSGLIFNVLKMLIPGLSFNIIESLAYGLTLAVAWGILLIFWERVHYKYGLEYFYGQWVGKFSGSTKTAKLKG
jgi:hypothetical protein